MIRVILCAAFLSAFLLSSVRLDCPPPDPNPEYERAFLRNFFVKIQ